MVDGKTFHPGADKNSNLHYGKVVFAHTVVSKNTREIDFAGFEPYKQTSLRRFKANSKMHAAK